MSGALTEEQRQRIEANRQRALQRKIQRQQPQNGHASARYANPIAFDYNEARPQNGDGPAPTFDYDEVPLNNNSSARESFGDSGIDWDEAIAMDTCAKNQPSNAPYNQNKRKLNSTEPSITSHQSNHDNNGKRPGDENRFDHHGVNSDRSVDKSSLTEDQKIRIEKNRLRALEKKKRAATSSTEMVINAHHLEQTNHNSSTTHEFNCTASLTQNKPHISRDQKARMETNRLKALEKKRQAMDSSCTSTLTDEQKVLVEQKRLLALQKKQSSLSMKSISFTTEQNSMAVGTGNIESTPICQQPTEVNTRDTQSDSVHVLTEEQHILIEAKRIAAVQKKQSRLIAANSSLASQSNNGSLQQHNYAAISCTGTEQSSNRVDVQPLVLSSAAMSTKSGPSTEIQLPDSRAETVQEAQTALSNNQMSSLTDAQRALIEQKRLIALQKKQSLRSTTIEDISHKSDREQQSLVRRAVDDVSSLRVVPPINDSDKAHQPAREMPQQVTSDAGIENSSANESPPSPKKDRLIESGLPTLPPDLRYESSRCLPVQDEYSGTLIENAELDKPLLNGWSLFDHQKEGVSRALRMRRLILAFDMGLGQ